MYQKNIRGLGTILDEINTQREKMINCAMTNGFTNELTIKYSQELDLLIYEYQQASFTTSSTKQVQVGFKFSFQQLLISRPEAILV